MTERPSYMIYPGSYKASLTIKNTEGTLDSYKGIIYLNYDSEERRIYIAFEYKEPPSILRKDQEFVSNNHQMSFHLFEKSLFHSSRPLGIIMDFSSIENWSNTSDNSTGIMTIDPNQDSFRMRTMYCTSPYSRDVAFADIQTWIRLNPSPSPKVDTSPIKPFKSSSTPINVPIMICHVTQPSPVTCTHACLSMVSGIPIEELIERFGFEAQGLEMEATVLTECGILPVYQGLSSHLFEQLYLSDNPDNFDTYLVTVPSLRKLGTNHRIVLSFIEGVPTIYDPNKGRDGVEYYTTGGFLGNNGEHRLPISEVTLLSTMTFHKGNVEREKRYIDRNLELEKGKQND